MKLEEIKEGILNNDKRAIAKAITMIEENKLEIYEVLKDFKEFMGKAKVIGITGPPGVGKSTLISRLIAEGLKRGEKIGVLLVDPSSPISGGALLGNRVRMIENSTHENVYVRSFATRGWMGGLSRPISEAINILEASGKSIIFIETVGAGQIETEIAKKADIVLVVLMPYSGDEIQALKAGLMEIGDIYVINKSDLDKVRNLHVILRTTLGVEKTKRTIYVSALYNEGIKELFDLINSCWDEYIKTGEIERRRKERIKNELIETINDLMQRFIKSFIANNNLIQELAEKIYDKRITLVDAKRILIDELNKKFSLI
jgi:LAO/AO transport system kinase